MYPVPIGRKISRLSMSTPTSVSTLMFLQQHVEEHDMGDMGPTHTKPVRPCPGMVDSL